MHKTFSPWKRRMMSMTAVALAAVVITGQADGQSPAGQPTLESSVLQSQIVPVVQGETLPVPPQDAPAAGQPVPDQPAAGEPGCACGPVCVYNPCIKYVGERRLRRFCCGCECPTFEKVTITVEDPARCGCAVDIPICVPTCCKGEPCVSGRCGLFGSGIVWLRWDCGYKVRVLYAGNNACKGRKVVVSYFGK